MHLMFCTAWALTLQAYEVGARPILIPGTQQEID